LRETAIDPLLPVASGGYMELYLRGLSCRDFIREVSAKDQADAEVQTGRKYPSAPPSFHSQSDKHP